MITYKQTSTYTKRSSEDENFQQKFCYVRLLKVLPLKTETIKKVIYNKELNMHFESPESYYMYEIEVDNVRMSLDKAFRKAQDFNTRLNYKYDWIKFEKSSYGKITKILNRDELRNNLNQIKKRLLLNYKGEEAKEYLEKLTTDFLNDQHFNSIFNQYYEYGLMFPPIPETHKSDWKKERLITLDKKPESTLLETIAFDHANDVSRKYILSWEKQEPNSPLEIKQASGYIEYCRFSHRIQKSCVDITYTYDDSIINQWEFKLEKIDNLKN